ncbi:MAG: redoxin domain-containing protein [Fimbriiglobus sp.]|nr:redoxin domain-containing protein [Fimbriiglobus sp.]
MSPSSSPSPRWVVPVVVACTLTVAVAVVVLVSTPRPGSPPQLSAAQNPPKERAKAPEFPDKMDWLNTAGPLKLADLKGKIVLLDFWTLCCINCIHILPDLAKLEKKYEKELVVIGVHSAKFENEKDTKSIRKAVLRYEIAHPVVNDADHKIWDSYEVSSWPTFALIDAEGKFVGVTSGEGNLELLDTVIGKLVEEAKDKKVLNDKPMRFDLVRYREAGDTPLFFPGKVLADEKSDRLFVADSTHHRIVVTNLKGEKQAVIGTGTPGSKDGKFAEVQFDDPQGMALVGDTLYIADRKNHTIRAADLKGGTVKTVAGTGQQARDTRTIDTPADPLKTGLNSPWDLLKVGDTLFVAMAGHHQIWAYDLKANKIQSYSGTGRENIDDGPLYAANYGQPSGLAADDKYLYVADSEGSAIRRLPHNGEGRVSTLIGSPGRGSLFYFGDVDGPADKAKLQHALGVAVYNDKLLITDTYNSKLKEYDPATKTLKTLLGGEAKDPAFNEPAGLSVAGGKLYVADTNAHRIRVVDLKTMAVSTLELKGVEPPPPQKEWLPPKKDGK